MKSIERYILEGKKFIVFVLCGLPGSGKSTWVKENHPDLPVVSRDIIRAKLGFTKDADHKAVLSGYQEKQVSSEEYFQIAKYAKRKQSFIVDDTNNVLKYRKNLLDTLRSYDATIIGVNVDTPVEICINRRRGQIPADVLMSLDQKRIPLKEEDVDELINVKGY